MVFWLINMLHKLIDTCLLSVPSIRAYMLRGYALRWGGFKKTLTFSPEYRTRNRIFAGISAGLLLIGLLIVFLANAN